MYLNMLVTGQGRRGKRLISTSDSREHCTPYENITSKAETMINVMQEDLAIRRRRCPLFTHHPGHRPALMLLRANMRDQQTRSSSKGILAWPQVRDRKRIWPQIVGRDRTTSSCRWPETRIPNDHCPSHPELSRYTNRTSTVTVDAVERSTVPKRAPLDTMTWISCAS